MRSPSASELLRIWERGLIPQSLIQRALELLSAVYPQVSMNSLLALSIGRRDGELLALREQLFGPDMEAVAVCPQCGERLDLKLSAAEMRSAVAACSSEITLSMAGYDLQFRLPNSEDVTLALESNDLDGSRKRLLERCMLSVELQGAPIACDELPREIVDAISDRMANSDPLADIRLAVSCPSCDHSWDAAFDIVFFLSREIQSLAGRLLREVHTLASAYGWRERDILALSPVRRQFYLALVGA